MEDKKVKAGNVAIGICLFVIAILLVLIVVFFYNTTIEKNNLQAKISELETTLEEKESLINTDDLDNKLIIPTVYTADIKNLIKDVNYDLGVDNGYFHISTRNNRITLTFSKDEKELKNISDYFKIAEKDVKVKPHKPIEVTGFSKKVVDTEIGCMGQDSTLATFIFLMEDGTLEYSDMKNMLTNVSSQGKIKGLKDIVRIQNVDVWAPEDVGYLSMVAIDKDNICYDISDYINNEKKLLSEEEAKKLIKEKYELAIDLFCDVGEFQYISDINDSRVIKEKVEGQNYESYYYPITNYDEIVNKNLSNNIKSYFEEKNSMIITKNDKKYTTDGGVGFISYDGIEEIKDINITDEKIKCIVKIKCSDIDGKFTEYRESDFSIIKDGDNWLIEKFDFDKIF